jgi:hypothetical protein
MALNKNILKCKQATKGKVVVVVLMILLLSVNNLIQVSHSTNFLDSDLISQGGCIMLTYTSRYSRNMAQQYCH